MSDATREQVPDTVWTEHVSLSERMPRWLGMLIVFTVFLGTWQAVYWAELVSHIILPGPADVWRNLLFVGENIVTGGYMLRSLWVTIQEVAWGFAIALALGFTLGVIVGETTFGERAILPYLVAIDTMPKVAFAPLFIAWLGFGIESKIALAAFVATFSVVVGTAAGLHAADENARMLFKTMGASRWQTLTQLKLPAGLPQLFTGLKIAAVSVMAGAITGEFLGGGRGFGELIRVASTNLDIARVFSLIIYLSLVGLTLFMLVGYAQKRLVFWARSSNSGLP